MKILVVEDDQMLLRMYQRQLESGGHTTVGLIDGTNIVATAKSEKPDVVMLDVLMPNVNGIDALKQLKADEATQGIPVIMLSGKDDVDLMQECLDLGANRFLVKSETEPHELFDHLKSAVENKK